MTVETGKKIDATESGQYLTFFVKEKQYGIDLHCVKEIVELGKVTRVPMSNISIYGVINLRGCIIPVLDLAHRLNGENICINKKSSIVIVEVLDSGETCKVGWAVDVVDAVLDLKVDELTSAPAFGTGIRPEFINSVATVEDRLLAILDVSTIVSVEELSQVNFNVAV